MFYLGILEASYRVRLYPPSGYSILYKEHNLTRFNHTTKRSSSDPRWPGARVLSSTASEHNVGEVPSRDLLRNF